ncbi:Transcription factor GRAS [Dillenia turbinata]|uniref:Transcription factor GRAS n=1 Tax=Dillenia turbinata TaxID=194707 RepID=A0AAN8ZAD1_9MAGN
MAYEFCVGPELFDNECSDEVNGLDLSQSALPYHAFPNLPSIENGSSTWFIPLSNEERNSKRLKPAPITPEESVGRNSSAYMGESRGSAKSLNSLPRLHVRDHICAYTQRYLAVGAMEEEASSLMGPGSEGNDDKEEGSGDAMRLVQQLITCAEAVACRDKLHASALLSELRTEALIFGSSFQRVASCFVQGLSDRHALVQPLGAVGLLGPGANEIVVTAEKEDALSLVYEIFPQIQFGHFVANASILEAFEGESSVHIIDLGMSLGLRHGHQWRQLMQTLATCGGKQLRCLRVTAVGNSAERLQAIGDELELYAKGLKLNFKFSVLESNLETLQPQDISLIDGEILVINSILQLHSVVKESRGALNSVLQRMHDLSPKLLVLVEQDSSHNGPFFLGRFMEALHYYSAIFDALDTVLPKYDTRRAKIEQFYFADEIKNIVSCEGPARVERHERIDQWRRRMSRAGFHLSPIKMMMQAKQWLEKIKTCEGYTIVEEKGCLVLGWKSKPIVAASCWKCS